MIIDLNNQLVAVLQNELMKYGVTEMPKMSPVSPIVVINTNVAPKNGRR